MYYCEVCNQLSQTGQTCFIQHNDESEEKCCANCYNRDIEIMFNIRKSLNALNNNLSFLQEDLKNIDRNNRDYYTLAYKLRKTEERIAKDKIILGEK